MTNTNAAKIEFEMLFESLKESIEKADELLTTTTPDIEQLKVLRDTLTLLSNEVSEYRPTSKTKEKEVMYDYSTAISTIIKTKLIIVRLNSKIPVELAPSPSARAVEYARLPEIKVPEFRGDILQYNNFIQDFDAAVHIRQIPKTQKLQLLRGYLKDSALTLVQHLQLQPESYDEARRVAADNPESIKKTYDQIEGVLNALNLHGENLDTNVYLFSKVMAKYPREYIRALTKGEPELPKLTALQRRIMTQIRLDENLDRHVPSNVNQLTLLPKGTLSALVAGEVNSTPVNRTTKSPSCIFCNGAHYNDCCSKYTTVTDRKAQIKDRCFICLRTGHTLKNCNSQKACFHCQEKRRHHQSLCPSKFGYQPNPRKSISNPDGKSEPNNDSNASAERNQSPVHLSNIEKGTYLTVLVPVQNQVTGDRTHLRALLDCGSAATYVTNDAAKKLRLPEENSRSVSVDVFGTSTSVNFATALTALRVSNDRGFVLDIHANTTPLISKKVTSFEIDKFRTKYPQYAGLDFADPGNNGNIDLLIGNDYLFELLNTSSKITVENGLHLLYSVFGWLVVGRTKSKDTSSLPVLLATAESLNRLWSLDTIGIKEKQLTEQEEEEAAIQQFYKNITYDDGHYTVSWPWRRFPPNIPHNRGLALGCLRSLLNRYKNSTQYLEATEKIFQQQLESRIIEEIPYDNNLEDVHYLPYQLVIQDGKSTPVRIVLNGSARVSKQEKSLNDCIYKGKNLMTKQLSILLRFRIGEVAVTADAEKAFHKIGIQSNDRDYTRLLWVHDLTKPLTPENLRVFRFCKIAFGITASPFLLSATITHHLDQRPNEFTKQLKKDLYVDNLITTVPDSTVAHQLYESAYHSFEKAGMNLRLWNTNDRALYNALPLQHRDPKTTISVLGLLWNTHDDSIAVKAPPPIDTLKPSTLRTVLKLSSKFYDPVGWYAPLNINAKMLMKDIRLRNLEWDDSLPVDLTQKWHEIHQDLCLPEINPLSRYIPTLSDDDGLQLHVFSDASKTAYATAAYLRIENKKGIKTYLLFAKARVSPMKELTIPKLELLGLLIAVRALQFVVDAIEFPSSPRMICWTDSKCVLFWVKTNQILPTFVQNKVDEIKLIPEVQFRHIPGVDNPADIPSRGSTFDSLQNSTLWWSGPDFLVQSEATWPEVDMAFVELSIELERPVNNVLAIPNQQENQRLLFDPTKYSNYRPFIRVTAYVVRALRKFSAKNEKPLFADPNKTTLTYAKELWIRNEQFNHFGEVFRQLKTGKANHMVSKLRITLNEEGFLVYSDRFPLQFSLIFLPPPKVSYFVRLLIMNEHIRNLHVGTAHTLSEIRKEYWINQGRRAVYNVIRSCGECKRFGCKPYQQPLFSTLPDFRVLQAEYPFVNTGLDAIGPLYCNQQKRWILICTCLQTRAISLELLTDQTAEEFAYAFRRFSARRTAPKLILSDHAAQFEAFQAVTPSIFADELIWKYTPETAAWFGATYERLIALVKHALLCTFRNLLLDDRQLMTVLFEIENTLNNRPLTYVGEEVIQPLTPNDFLKIRVPSVVLDPDTTTVRKRILENWKYGNALLDHFWAQWREHYLPFLRERIETYNFKKKTNRRILPRVGEVVLVSAPRVSRNKWRLAKITEVHVSRDGEIRSATVRLGNGNFISRPIQDLYPLETTPAPEPDEEEFDEIISIEVEEIEE